MKLLSPKSAYEKLFADTPEEDRPTFRTFQNWRATGAIESTKIGGRVFINYSQLEAKFGGGEENATQPEGVSA